MNHASLSIRVFKPTSLFIPGTNIYTSVERWEVVGRRVHTYFQDGLVMHSEETLSSLLSGGFAKEVR